MCGRFLMKMTEAKLARLTGAAWEAWGFKARYNIAPSQPVFTVRVEREERVGRMLHWGLVPPWAKDVSIGYRMINARSETAHEKPSFKHAFRRRRCLIPADGFYEWRKTPDVNGDGSSRRPKKPRQPYLITMADEQPFCMAGLWEHWQDAEGNELESGTILTTAANELVGELHDRMPVIMEQDRYRHWLDPANEDAADLRGLCVPYPAELMMYRPVSTIVNSPGNEGPACMEPVDADPIQGDESQGNGQDSLF